MDQLKFHLEAERKRIIRELEQSSWFDRMSGREAVNLDVARRIVNGLS